MLFAEWGIFCRLTGVRLQGPRTFLRLVKLGAWVVLHRGGGRGGRGGAHSPPGLAVAAFNLGTVVVLLVLFRGLASGKSAMISL